MMYDLEDAARRVAKNQKHFLTQMAVATGLILISLCVMLWNFDKTATFIGGAVIAASLIWICNATIKQSPSILFSRALEGINIKEDEYVARRTQGALKGSSRVPHLPHTYANKKASVPRHLIRGRVYLRLEGGSVSSWSGLFPKHMDIYEEGDLLYKPAGARFFFVTSREPKEQPCPLCGAINTKQNRECTGCGLMIVKKQNRTASSP